MLTSTSIPKILPGHKQVNIGILGLGTVGTGVVKILREQQDLLRERSGLTLNLKSIAELNWYKKCDLNLTGVHCTQQAEDILNDPSIDIIVETIGGIDLAFRYICKALENHKHVVTANKALLALKGQQLFKLADLYGVRLLFEASVGGGIPIIKGLYEGLVANRIQTIYGILNGTTNYILTKMHEEELEFSQALKDAQVKGFAESDPTLDINGSDAAHKLTILSSIASSGWVDFQKIYIEGIQEVTQTDIQFAKKLGTTIKLLAIYQQTPDGLDIRVHPVLVPNSHLLAAVKNELNAIFVKGDFVGETMFYGPGAGQNPTASAVVGDLVDISKNFFKKPKHELNHTIFNLNHRPKTIPIFKTQSRFLLQFKVPSNDCLIKILDILDQMEIGIQELIQPEVVNNDQSRQFGIITVTTLEEKIDKTLEVIQKLQLGEPFSLLRFFN